MNDLTVVFAGTPEFGLPCLDALIQSRHHLKAVYTQPDRPAGRGRKLQESPVKEWAINHQIPVYQPLNFKNQEAVDELSALKPDVMVVIAYGLILPKAVLEIPRLGCINVHASLLPRWRGASPIQHAILHGDAESGVTIMQMDVGLDTGPMLCKATCPVTSSDTAGSLHDKLAKMSVKPLLDVLEALASNSAQFELQNN
ncbi:TPA: methionyl-tRNA formyltransferase, partial [Legionella pneumophila]|nr:methionyl-tRNA formyltransferase [Legionella pneumophila]